MKLLTSVCIVLALAVALARRAAAETVIGPGVLPPQQATSSTGTRFVAGTEIIATAPWVPSITGETTKSAVYLYSYGSNTTFDGGRYEGLSSVAGSPNYTSPGSVLGMYTQSNPTVVIKDGIFRGGSVLVDTPAAAAGYDGAIALPMWTRYLSNLIVLGGVIEGGTVALQSDPTTPLKRALAIDAQGYYEYSRQQVDIYGGTIVGGISLRGMSRFTVHGSNLAISPDPAGPFFGGQFMITGNYANGQPFSHNVTANLYRSGSIIKTPNSITLEANIPEPSGLSLMLASVLAAPRLRRRRGLKLSLSRTALWV